MVKASDIIRNPLFKVLIRLGLTEMMLDKYWKTESSEKRDEIASTGVMQKPTSVWFEPTMRCNLKCKFCHQRNRPRRNELSINEIDKLFKQMSLNGIKKISLIGGEVFLRKDMFEILDLCESSKFEVKIGTNGTLLTKEKILRLKKYHSIENVSISIDGSKDIHNMLRGNRDAYDKAIFSLQNLSDAHFTTGIYTVLLPDQLEKVPFLINLARDLKVGRITFMPEMFYSQEEIEITKSSLSLSDEDKIYADVTENVEVEPYFLKMKEAINLIRKTRQKYGVFAPIYPRIAYKFPDVFFRNRIRSKCKLICTHFNTLTIIENGDVVICPFIQKKLGNVTINSINDIWNSDDFKKMRINLMQGNLAPICSKCCGLDYVK